MPNHDIIVIGASAGGVEAVSHLVRDLPEDIPAAIFVVLHIPSFSTSVLPAILTRKGPLPAKHPEDGERIKNGMIYVAPPDHHLLLSDNHIQLSRGPSENGHRPAVDTLFRSAARTAGPRVIGVVLSGALDDGTSGMRTIQERGGITVIQDPDDALFSSMPQSVAESIKVDHILPITKIGALLGELSHLPVETKDSAPVSRELTTVTEIAKMNMDAIEAERAGVPSGFTCPDCHGVLWEVEEGDSLRFRCRVGHAYSPDSLLSSQMHGLEDALWTALRALEESAALSENLQKRAEHRGHRHNASRFSKQAKDALERAEIVRKALLHAQANEEDEANQSTETREVKTNHSKNNHS